LSEIAVWPAVTLVLAIVYRKEISRLFQNVGGKISKFTAVGITLEFASARPAAESLRALLDQLREPSSAGLQPSSDAMPLIALAKAAPAADYIVIDLRGGKAWLTSRLYLFAAVLPQLIPLRCLVFVGKRGQVPRYFLGIASPERVIRELDKHFPWLRSAMVESQLQQVVSANAPQRYVRWFPPTDELKAALKQLTQGPAVDILDVPRADALDKIIRGLVSPVDLLLPGQVEALVDRFIHSPSIRRPLNSPWCKWSPLRSCR